MWWQVMCLFCYHKPHKIFQFSAFPPLSQPSVPIPIAFLKLDSTSEWREVVGKSQCRWEARNTVVYSRSPDVSVEVRWSQGYHAMGTVMIILPWPDMSCSGSAFHHNNPVAPWWSWGQTRPETHLPIGLLQLFLPYPYHPEHEVWQVPPATSHFWLKIKNWCSNRLTRVHENICCKTTNFCDWNVFHAPYWLNDLEFQVAECGRKKKRQLNKTNCIG